METYDFPVKYYCAHADKFEPKSWKIGFLVLELGPIVIALSEKKMEEVTGEMKIKDSEACLRGCSHWPMGKGEGEGE